MAIVKCKPTSPGRRHVVKIVNQDLYKGKPFAALLDKKDKSGGRNNNVPSPPVTSAVVTSNTTVSSTSSATKTVSRPK
jgi:ribosomal protein L2